MENRRKTEESGVEWRGEEEVDEISREVKQH